jgi:hypothetical protein
MRVKVRYLACLFSHSRFVVSIPSPRRLLMNPVCLSGIAIHVHGESSALHRTNGFDDASRWLCAQTHNQNVPPCGRRAELRCGALRWRRILAPLQTQRGDRYRPALSNSRCKKVSRDRLGSSRFRARRHCLGEVCNRHGSLCRNARPLRDD